MASRQSCLVYGSLRFVLALEVAINEKVHHIAEPRVLRSYIMGLFAFSVTFSERQVMVTATKELIQAVADVRREPPPTEEVEVILMI